MKFVKLLKYVENSFENKPSFLILMSDGKEYISIGCVFVENTKENIKVLIEEHDCTQFLDGLFSSDGIDISEIENTRYMFNGCTSLTEFKCDMPNVTDANNMFNGCISLVKFHSDMPNVISTYCMFLDCTSLTEFHSDMPNVTNINYMFDGCKSLNL